MRVGIDVGGTFTDLAAIAPDGVVTVRKVATTPADPAAGMLRALDALGDGRAVSLLVHGTTIATNALLERRGARVVLVATAGFEDLLWLRRQDRPSLYDLTADHPPPPIARHDVIGVAERMGPDGVVAVLTDGEIARVVAAVTAVKPEAVAVAFLFAFRHADHERRIAAALRAALPGVPVAASHEVLPLFREYERTSTTVAEAYLRPLVSRYLGRTGDEVARRGVGGLRIMTSAGGTATPDAAARQAAALALSGPAGGVVGGGLAGRAAGVTDLLTLDMGGTSADASLVAGGAALSETSAVVGGVPLALPAVLIETVSAGGGSIAWVDAGGSLKVGPRSAGAAPGPACYGRGGREPTVTDACLVLGWLDADHPLADAVRLDRAAAERALAPVAQAIGRDLVGAATGIVDVATAVMARALKRVSVARGVDPRALALLPFGGAGPLFGCALADALGMTRVIIPPHPGALSALGLAAAPERVDAVAALHRRLDAVDRATLADALAPLVERARAALPGGVIRLAADCRYAGQGYEVAVDLPDADPAAIAPRFAAAHRTRYGYVDDSAPIDVVNVRVTAERAAPLPALRGRGGAGKPAGRREVVVRGARVAAEVWPLDDLAPGTTLCGPAVLAGGDATALLEPGWRATVHATGAVMAERR